MAPVCKGVRKAYIASAAMHRTLTWHSSRVSLAALSEWLSLPLAVNVPDRLSDIVGVFKRIEYAQR
jgi:hypothetical protein